MFVYTYIYVYKHTRTDGTVACMLVKTPEHSGVQGGSSAGGSLTIRLLSKLDLAAAGIDGMHLSGVCCNTLQHTATHCNTLCNT